MVVVPSPLRKPVVLAEISWGTYPSLLQDYENRPGTRLTFDRETLAIIPPLPEHEFLSETPRDVVVAATRALGIEVHSLRSSTWKREDLQRGAEGDNSFYITAYCNCDSESVGGRHHLSANADSCSTLAISPERGLGCRRKSGPDPLRATRGLAIHRGLPFVVLLVSGAAKGR